MKATLLVILFFGYSQANAKHYSSDSCYTYYTNYKDKLLLSYLESFKLSSLDKKDQISYLYYKSIANWVESNPEKSIKYLVDGYELIQRYGTADSIKWKYLDQFANVYRRAKLKNRIKALGYINESINLKKKSNASPDHIAKSYFIKANIYFTAENKIDSALHYYHLAHDLNTIENNKYLYLGNISAVSIHLNKLDSVESYLTQSINYNKRLNNHKSSTVNTGNLALYYAKVGNVSLARDILDSLVQLTFDNGWINSHRSALHNQVRCSEMIKDFQSQVYWTDSLYAFEKTHYDQRITELTEKFTLENKLAHATATTYRNRWWLSILGGGTGTLCLFLFGLLKYFSLKRQKVEEELEAVQVKSALDATKAKMEGEQKERESIASILHDQVASLLTAADLHLNVAQRNDPSALGIHKVVNIIKNINTQVRDISHQLVSPSLTRFGLEAGIDDLIDRMQTKQLNIFYVSKLGSKRYDRSIEVFLQQSASEILECIKNKGTTTLARIVLSESDSMIKLSISYNEKVHEANNLSEVGFTQIQTRAAALGGSLTLTPDPDNIDLLLVIPYVGILAN